MLDDKLEKRIRLLQAKAIQKSSQAVSFSDALEEVVRKGLKNGQG